MDYKCVNCQINAFSRLLDEHKVPKIDADNAFREFLNYLSFITALKIAIAGNIPKQTILK